MKDKAVLLNSGRELDVDPIEGSHQYLARILGSSPSKLAVMFLRATMDPGGKETVGVYVGTELVGYLPAGGDRGVLETVQACELNGAVARARGKVLASWERPGEIVVKVDLADPEYLLCEPEPDMRDGLQVESPEQQAEVAPAEATSDPFASRTPEPILSSSLEQAPALDMSGGMTNNASSFEHSASTTSSTSPLRDEAASALSAGLTEDYPDWPPPKPNDPPTDAQATGYPSVAQEPQAATDGERALLSQELQDQESQPEEPQRPSPQEILASRSAILGGAVMPSQIGQPGWLGSTLKSPRGDTPGTPGGGALTSSAPQPLGGGLNPTGSVATQDQSWQGSSAKPGGGGNLDDEIVAAWGTSAAGAPSPQPVADFKPASASHATRTWLMAALAVAVVVAVGLLVWKFMFAPKTYTSEQYGYSFSYPGRWELMSENDMFLGYATMTDVAPLLSTSAAGFGFDAFNPNEAAAVAVLMFGADAFGDDVQLEAAMQSGYGQVEMTQPGFTLLEPVTAVTVGGLSGYRTTMSADVAGFGVNATLCFLIDADASYFLLTMSTPNAWVDCQNDFDRFFDSFKPGGTMM